MIEETVHRRFIDNGWTLSLAESCTGGHLAARLTRLPGASRYFLGSLIAYSNSLKINLLKVPPALIEQHGAVSSEVASAMATNILHLTQSDYAIAVTGIAGPDGGTPTKPVGTIWGSIASKQGVHTWQFHLSGSRDRIMEEAVDVLLKELLTLTV